jgi:hypothetical protein
MRFKTHIFTLALLLLFGLQNRASAQVDTLWTKLYNLETTAALIAAAELSTGGFVGVGFTITLPPSSHEDAIIMRYGPLGDTLWTRKSNIPASGERFYDIAELANGNIVACGYNGSGLNAFLACYTQQGGEVWTRSYDAGQVEEARSVLPLEDGGFYVLGSQYLPNRQSEFWLLRCNANGDTLYSRTFGTTGIDIPDQVLMAPNGNLYLTGSARETNTNQVDFYIVTTDGEGEFIRERTVGGPNWEMAFSATVDTSSGDLIVSGETRPSADRDAFAVRLNEQGDILWQLPFDNNAVSEVFSGVAPFLEGGAVFGGLSGSNPNAGRLWLVATAANGDTSWTWTGTVVGQAFEDLVRVSDGGFIACGRASRFGHDNPLMWRISPPSGVSGIVYDRVTNEPVAGVRVQAAELPQYAESDTVGRFSLALPPGIYSIYTGGPCFSGDTLHNIEVLANENTTSNITVGVAHLSVNYSTINIVGPNQGEGSTDMVFSNAGSGDLVYSFEALTIYPRDNWLRVDPPNGRLAPGDTMVAQVILEPDTTNDGTFDYFGEIKFHSNSCPDTVLMFDVLAVVLDADETPALPSEFALYPSYPNPFNSSTRLRFGLDHDSDVSLRVYDVTGREVAVLLDNSKLAAGEHSLTWAPSGLASGLYFVRMSDRTRNLTQRLLYIR